ncbi:hypothetical protein TNCV_4631141 [Trichonephila clavipes]|nr:hypothetical protein TNCV_4631141 [Trichonephila clavipes]
MNKIRKTPAGFNCPTVSSEEFLKTDDDNVCTAPIMADKYLLESVQSLKNIIDADSDDLNEMNNAASVSMSSETRNIVKNGLRSFEPWSSDEDDTKLAPPLQLPYTNGRVFEPRYIQRPSLPCTVDLQWYWVRTHDTPATNPLP